MEENKTNEPKLRLNIKQNTKGYAYYDLTVRGDTIEEVTERINQIVALATSKTNEINGD